MRYLFYIIRLHLIIAAPQINLYDTDWTNGDNVNTLQHNCLRVIASIEEVNINHQIIYYCMSDWPSAFNIQGNNIFSNFSFIELSKRNITSEQLYHWSAPIDLIENYQFYLDQLFILHDQPNITGIFYNCTMPRFGPMCQYEFDYYNPIHSSLHQIIDDFYQNYEYQPINMTCYTHLQCNRGPFPACLDWSEICNGHVDCLDGIFDEEHCWQLEINQCNDNEYRC